MMHATSLQFQTESARWYPLTLRAPKKPGKRRGAKKVGRGPGSRGQMALWAAGADPLVVSHVLLRAWNRANRARPAPRLPP